MADQGTQSNASSSSYQRDNSSQGPNYRFQHPQMRAPDNLRGPELNFRGLIPFDSDGGGWQDQAPSLSTSMQHGLELVQDVVSALEPSPEIQVRLTKRRRPDDFEQAAPTVMVKTPLSPAEQAEALYRSWTARDVPTSGLLVQEFDVLCHSRGLQRFKVSFADNQQNGLPSLSLQNLMQSARDAYLEKYKKQVPDGHFIPINDDLAAFAVARVAHWMQHDCDQVLKICYPDKEQPWRADLDLIPGTPPSLGVLHNADVIRKELPSFLFQDLKLGIMKPAFEAAIVTVAYGLDPVTPAMSWIVPAFRIGGSKRIITLETCSTAGTIQYFCLLCHKTGVYQPSVMDVEEFYPVFQEILRLLEAVYKSPLCSAFRERLHELRESGRAVSGVTNYKNVFQPLTMIQ